MAFEIMTFHLEHPYKYEDLKLWFKENYSHLPESLVIQNVPFTDIRKAVDVAICSVDAHISSGNKAYRDPIIDIEDKIGTRVVLLRTDDISVLSNKILESEFWEAKITKSTDQEIEDKPKIFDYQSQHIVVLPRVDRGFNEELRIKLSCEIQIRTLLQHAFAEVSHDSTYKGPYKNDKEILRKLSKSMALMEATDDYFCSIFKLMTDQTRKYSNFYNELITIYKKLGLEFNREDMAFEMTESLISLLEQQDVPVNELETFIIKKVDELKVSIKPENGLIYSQPISILVAYYLFNHKTFLEDNWPLSLDSLTHFQNSFGISSGDY